MGKSGHYSKIGNYTGYDKNHKERDKLDYYSTPTKEVTNILNILQIDLSDAVVLEPCCGGGHMVQGILDYMKPKKLIATDIKRRQSLLPDDSWYGGEEYDFIEDDYPYTEDIDYIIMNPPYSLLQPFLMKSLEIANKGIVALTRIQALEGQKRFQNIYKDNPPSDVYVYIDRISCYKNGIVVDKGDSVQAYAWLYWDLTKEPTNTILHWLHRIED